ncbi:hypothetical protein A3Q56_01083 [Intoshia linei]|uniref:Uncharacterized protein n=1 Tax=Intoshia linei TaxID=1819745 RepID=A0A177BBZ4_9BILA|nr:hypothetical protein A3Q56_01083 [Intoshia linei]
MSDKTDNRIKIEKIPEKEIPRTYNSDMNLNVNNTLNHSSDNTIDLKALEKMYQDELQTELKINSSAYRIYQEYRQYKRNGNVDAESRAARIYNESCDNLQSINSKIENLNLKLLTHHIETKETDQGK